jgi:predicted TIM-barrel fold metal-dependent hydrolase
MRPIIDVDTHVAESPQMWERIEPEMYPRRPVLVSVPSDTLYGRSNAFWLVDGDFFPKPAGKGSFNLITPSANDSNATRCAVSVERRELTDLAGRVADMDALGVRMQVVYPTLFLMYLTDDAPLEVALCRAYNRYLADACAATDGRLRWVVMPPLLTLDAAIAEIRWAKEHGAVGVFFRGMEGERTLDDPYFFPVYEEASGLDLPICIHTGGGCPTITRLFDVRRHGSMAQSRVLPLFAFRDLIANGVTAQFPRLRFGIIEAGAAWVPYVLHNLKRWFREEGDRSPRFFRDHRLFVACEADEDIPYLAQIIGEDNLMIGSDYGHNDPSEEPQLVATMQARGDLSDASLERIMCDTPARFYGL